MRGLPDGYPIFPFFMRGSASNPARKSIGTSTLLSSEAQKCLSAQGEWPPLSPGPPPGPRCTRCAVLVRVLGARSGWVYTQGGREVVYTQGGVYTHHGKEAYTTRVSRVAYTTRVGRVAYTPGYTHPGRHIHQVIHTQGGIMRHREASLRGIMRRREASLRGYSRLFPLFPEVKPGYSLLFPVIPGFCLPRS